MVFEEEYLERKLKGALAEQLFELLHLEMNCQVYRTGHEFLYPHLFQIANTKKKLYHKLFKEQDYENLINDLPEAEEIEYRGAIGDVRFLKSTTGKFIASSPDFTIVTPSGNIEQFEVKFRYGGDLEEEAKKKYLLLNPPPHIFLVTAKEPYIRILYPSRDPDTKKYGMPIANIDVDDDKLSNLFNKAKSYRELPKIKKDNPAYEEGDLVLIKPLKSEVLVYPVKLLEKYGNVIQKWFS